MRTAGADAHLRRRRTPWLQSGARPRGAAAGSRGPRCEFAGSDRRPRPEAQAILGRAGDPRRGPAGRPARTAAPAAHPGRQRGRARLRRGLAGRADEGGRGDDRASAGADRHRPSRAQPARDRVQAGNTEAQPRRGQGGAEEHGLDVHRPSRHDGRQHRRLPRPHRRLRVQDRERHRPGGDLGHHRRGDAGHPRRAVQPPALARRPPADAGKGQRIPAPRVAAGAGTGDGQRADAQDHLTTLPNRRGLARAFESEAARSERRDEPLSLAVLDIDNFKSVNDTLGHQAGDLALVHLARVVRQALRPSDVIARFGGEEFVILLSDTRVDDAVKVMTRVQRELTKRFFLHNNEKVLITFSAGVAQRVVGESQDDLVERADRALYRAKEAGKNRVLAA
ncbi:MAG: diguanylate cyclase [Betaproteobacteria bacterium]|nr:diguanylate cyclase [Betaproteobacteria bacterium]